jgi:hypothetical protein
MAGHRAALQKNVLNRRTWATRDELRAAIVTWIERTDHRRGRQAPLRLTLIEYETIMTRRALRPREPTCQLLVPKSRSRWTWLVDAAATSLVTSCRVFALCRAYGAEVTDVDAL